MSGIMTRWVVLHEHPVSTDDLDTDGVLADATVERWVTAARQAYLARCTLLQRARAESGLELTYRPGRLPLGARLGHPTDVAVSASASEVRPSSFTISVRLRMLVGDHDTAVNTTCTVALADKATGEVFPLGEHIRDELIALEHSANHFN